MGIELWYEERALPPSEWEGEGGVGFPGVSRSSSALVVLQGMTKPERGNTFFCWFRYGDGAFLELPASKELQLDRSRPKMSSAATRASNVRNIGWNVQVSVGSTMLLAWLCVFCWRLKARDRGCEAERSVLEWSHAEWTAASSSRSSFGSTVAGSLMLECWRRNIGNCACASERWGMHGVDSCSLWGDLCLAMACSSCNGSAGNLDSCWGDRCMHGNSCCSFSCPTWGRKLSHQLLLRQVFWGVRTVKGCRL